MPGGLAFLSDRLDRFRGSCPPRYPGAMDVLADLLEVTRLSGRVFCARSVKPPWGLRIEPGSTLRIHLVCRGSGWLLLPDAPPLKLGDGDVVLLPHGAGHALADDPTTPCIPLEAWKARS